MQLADFLSHDVDPSDPANRDPEFIRTVALPAFDALRTNYFLPEIEGRENSPRQRPFIAVANHNGGPVLPDCWVLVSYWWSALGPERPAYAMVHDAPLRVPLLRSFLIKVGGLRASSENAEKVLGLGAPLVIYPGGELDCLKSFWRRHTVDFHGRTGFIELALTAVEVHLSGWPAHRARARPGRCAGPARRAQGLRADHGRHAGKTTNVREGRFGHASPERAFITASTLHGRPDGRICGRFVCASRSFPLVRSGSTA